MKKVIIVTSDAFPNGMATSRRIKCYARPLREGGIETEVLVCRRTERFGVEPKNIAGSGMFKDIPFNYISNTPLRENNIFIRQLNDWRDTISTKRYLLDRLENGDVLFLYLEDIYKESLFIRAAHKKGASCIRDLCELPYSTRNDTWRARILRRIELRRIFPRLDGVISISSTLKRLATEHCKPSCKHLQVPILVDYEDYYLRDESEKSIIPYIFHSGTLSQQKDGIIGMLAGFGKAICEMPDPVHFISTGNIEDSSCQEEIQKVIDKYKIQDLVHFTGYLEDNEVQSYLSKASLVIVNKIRTQQNHYCFSTKLAEYLAAAKPVITTDFGEAARWLTDKQDAYIVKSGDTDALSKAIVYAFSHREESRRVGLAGQELCRQNFDYHQWTQQLCNIVV